MSLYNPKEIESKWQKKWEEENLFFAKDSGKKKEKFYHLVMFPYPSGNLHMGHWYNFTGADVYARKKFRDGYNVMSPIGFDAFGLPAENAAIKRKIHPKEWTLSNIETMRGQLRTAGFMYDWSREVVTCLPEYYQWTQWLFLKMYEKGLAYRKKAAANWCPNDQTVLANEQVVDGRCERCDAEVVQKEIDQWLLKTTDYAERLLNDLDKLDWPEKTKAMQRNWIGKSEGAIIKFRVQGLGSGVQDIEVFTTRADTLFGASYVVLAPEHPIVSSLRSRILNLEEVKTYINATKKKTERERLMGEETPTLAKGEVGGPTAKRVGQKTGVELKGIKVVNPANGEEVPVWISDYVLASYGTGAIMAVPAHDERDFEFAKKFKLPIIQVIASKEKPSEVDGAFTEEGVLVYSKEFNGITSQEARTKIVEWLAEKGLAKKKVQYKLRDWLISRQRYWGAPIPIIHCADCGTVPVKEKDLPVLLPDDVDFQPTGESPLARHHSFTNVKCPHCGKDAKRETDTMDTFVDSSWYFFRYTDAKNKKAFASKKHLDYWMKPSGVDLYIGGAEHSVLHLLYARFFTKVLFDAKLSPVDEPFGKLRHQGIILGPDGQKMSKSKGNVVDPDELVRDFGADSVRMYLMFMGPFELGGPWNPRGLNGIRRFLDRVWKLAEGLGDGVPGLGLEILRNKTIKKVTEDIEHLKFHTAIASLMEYVNAIEERGEKVQPDIQALVHLVSPFAPHIAEEIWDMWGNKKSIFQETWPAFDPKKTEETTISFVVQFNGKTRGMLQVGRGVSQKEVENLIQKDERLRNYLAGTPKKIIFVKDRLINFVL